MDILSEHWQKPNAMLTLLKDSSQEQRIVAFALSYTLETTDMYGVFQNAHVVEWLRKRIFGKIAVLTGIYQLPDIKIKNGEQLLLTETISHYLEQDYGYSIYYGADDER